MKNNKYCIIYLVRHGETDWNLKKLIQGHTDNPLNKKGIQQANKLRKILGHIKFDAFFSSDLLRAKQTAEIIALNYRLTVQTTKEIRERRYGIYEGKSFHDLNDFYIHLEKLGKKNKEMHTQMYRENNMETDEEVGERSITFLREISVAYPEKYVFVACHGGVMRVILNRLSGKSYQSGDIANTAYLEIHSDGVDFFLKSDYGVIDR